MYSELSQSVRHDSVALDQRTLSRFYATRHQAPQSGLLPSMHRASDTLGALNWHQSRLFHSLGSLFDNSNTSGAARYLVGHVNCFTLFLFDSQTKSCNKLSITTERRHAGRRSKNQPEGIKFAVSMMLTLIAKKPARLAYGSCARITTAKCVAASGIHGGISKEALT